MVAKLAKESSTRVQVTSEDAAADISLQSSRTRSSADPDHPDFRRGQTLGVEHTNWRQISGSQFANQCLSAAF
jgi:hypothetical protein